MKYLKKIFEEFSILPIDKPIPEEIINTFIGIYDVYGEPKKTLCQIIKDDTGEYIRYKLTWETDLRWMIRDTDKLQLAISNINKIIHDLSSAKGRLSKKYVCDFEFVGGVLEIICIVKPDTIID